MKKSHLISQPENHQNLQTQNTISNHELLADLEQKSRSLEPSQKELEELFRKTEAYAKQHLDNVCDTPAYVTSDDRSIGLLSSPITETGISLDEVLQQLYDHVDHEGLNSGSPRYLGYIPSGGIVHSAFGDFLAAIGGRYAGIFHSSPGAVRMENMLIRWMAGVVGYPKGSGGYLSSGGSIANLSAIIIAREAHGLRGADYDRAVIYMTEHTHHCVDKALRIAGMGSSIRRRVAEDGRCRMSAEALEKTIAADKASGLEPWLIVGSAGTTNTGTVDPLSDIASIARSNNLWFHVDGAYGAFFALCPEGKDILNGMNQSDSLVLDPHKTLFLPFGSGALLVRDQELMGPAHGGRGAYMIDMDSDAHELSPAYVSPELTKHFRGLRMWLPLKLLGVAPFRAALSEKIYLARYAYERLNTMNGIQVGPYPDLSIVTYRYVPKKGDANEFNRSLVRNLHKDGRVFMTSTQIGSTVVMRMAIGSFRTHLQDIDESLEILQNQIKQLDNC
ncbi:MAG: aminotransferase class V-fold PLP-dependent enzyme [Bacteroidetes bacterium]|nr:aminotransferase class V-fold PLP-dependent enzyme [Bacteroidota bacterium]